MSVSCLWVEDNGTFMRSTRPRTRTVPPGAEEKFPLFCGGAGKECIGIGSGDPVTLFSKVLFYNAKRCKSFYTHHNLCGGKICSICESAEFALPYATIGKSV